VAEGVALTGHIRDEGPVVAIYSWKRALEVAS
jgi:hypothetical protein